MSIPCSVRGDRQVLSEWFPIPMRGNETYDDLHGSSRSCASFPIPMRGNELWPQVFLAGFRVGFPIPMRGNEFVVAHGDLFHGAVVPDPHEG